ncbi:MAG: patatin-like phospholipase family protein [Spirochaetia bacterium]
MQRFFKKTVKILCIDGGGIRGYIPALVLAEVERRLRQQGNEKSLGTLFDFIAGTSTGSIITLGLTAPAEKEGDSESPRYSHKAAAFSAERLVHMYERHGLEIFPYWNLRQLQDMRHAFTEKYDNGPFHEILDGYFGRRKISDALTDMLITTYDIEQHRPLIMKKVPYKRQLGESSDYYMADVIKASAAAPTYFEPVRVASVDESRQHYLVDGGVFAVNPAMCAFVEAQRIFPRARKYVIFSLGTGEYIPDWDIEKVMRWGLLEWLQPSKKVPAVTILNNGQAQAVDYHLSHMPKVEYHRINVPLDGCSEDMDDASAENMSCLAQRAEQIILEQSSSLERMVRLLK